jgi:DNA-binding NarL/FixJ family response regulator
MHEDRPEGPYDPDVGREPAARVLLVEDNPGDARLLVEALREAAGAHVELTNVTRLAEGIRAVEGAHFDLVLLDLFLPDSAGIETFTTFRRQVPELPCVVLTGLSDERIGLAAVSAGARDVLVKGRVSFEGMVDAIARALDGAAGGPTAEGI